MKPRYKVGIDENGCGAWSGPIYVTGFCMPEDWSMTLQDSKKIKSEVASYATVLVLMEHHIEIISPEEIDTEGMVHCLLRAYRKIARHFQSIYPDCRIEIDGIRVPSGVRNVKAVKGGDGFVPHIQAAAIIGKAKRDDYMREQAKLYPHYRWETNAGYGTTDHLEGLNAHGLSPLHRTSFKPVRKFIRHAPDPIGANPVSKHLYSTWKSSGS